MQLAFFAYVHVHHEAENIVSYYRQQVKPEVIFIELGFSKGTSNLFLSWEWCTESYVDEEHILVLASIRLRNYSCKESSDLTSV